MTYTKEEIQAEIQAFAITLNAVRVNNGLVPLNINRGYKFTRLIEDNTNAQNEDTIVFIDNNNGDVYKPASNVARAKGVRGSVFNENMFDFMTQDGSGVIHYKRGPKPKQSTEGTTEVVGEVVVNTYNDPVTSS